MVRIDDRIYLALMGHDLDKDIKIENKFICSQNHLIYTITIDVICET